MSRLLALILILSSFNALAANVFEALEESGNFKTLTTILEKSGFDEVLKEKRRLTVFAPTDEAFAKLSQDEINVVLNDQELLKAVLLYHVAEPTLPKKVIRVLNGVKTISGKYITKFGTKENYTLNNARILKADIHADNGIIHGIDEVLIPTENTSNNEIQTVDFVDVESYLGFWYEIYRYPNSFERGCGSVTAEYRALAPGKIRVLNTCVKQNGNKRVGKATAFVTNKETNASLKVSFVPFLQRWGLFGGDYNIIGLGSDYEYAVVGSKDRNFLWFLSRAPELTQNQLLIMKSIAISQGYDPNRMIKTPKY